MTDRLTILEREGRRISKVPEKAGGNALWERVGDIVVLGSGKLRELPSGGFCVPCEVGDDMVISSEV